MKSSPHSDTSHALAWQGITVPIPEDWNLAAISGDWDSGYLRAESPYDAAIELKWKFEKTSPSLKGLLKNYLKQLHKSAGRKGPEIPFKEKPKALPSVPQGAGVSQTFGWRSGDVSGVGAVWHCLECRRIVLVQITSTVQMTVDSLAKRIIPKISDHPDGSQCRWCVYDFDVTLPKEFRLEKQSLKSGHLSLELKNKGRTIVLERYGPANVLLKRDTLAEWATAVKPIFDRLKSFRYKKTGLDDAPGHEAVLLTGRRKPVKDVLIRIGLWFVRMQPPDALRAEVWHCAPSNRIFLAMVEARPREVEELSETVIGGIQCHAPEE